VYFFVFLFPAGASSRRGGTKIPPAHRTNDFRRALTKARVGEKQRFPRLGTIFARAEALAPLISTGARFPHPGLPTPRKTYLPDKNQGRAVIPRFFFGLLPPLARRFSSHANECYGGCYPS
jgi:hypothetical protein